MRITNAINFYCRSCKMDRKGLAPIEVSLTINGKRTFISLPRKEAPEVFAKQKKRQSTELCKYLQKIRQKLNEVQTELIEQEIPITAEFIKDFIKGGGIKEYTVEDMFQEYMDILKERVGVTVKDCSYKKYQIVYKEFISYFEKNRQAGSFNPADIRRYYAHLDTIFKKSTVASKMSKLRAVYKFAYTSGKIKTYPFNGIVIRRGTPKIEFLTEEEMKRIIGYNYPNERLERVADLFVFQACSGLSYVDMANLSRGDIKSYKGLNFIQKNRVKTGVQYTAAIFPQGIEILQKYRYKLPVISNQRYNSYLKDIQSLCRIDKNLHSHLARKTYSCMLLNSGVQITTVAKALGHSTICTSLKHYAKLLDTTVLEEIHNIM